MDVRMDGVDGDVSDLTEDIIIDLDGSVVYPPCRFSRTPRRDLHQTVRTWTEEKRVCLFWHESGKNRLTAAVGLFSQRTAALAALASLEHVWPRARLDVIRNSRHVALQHLSLLWERIGVCMNQLLAFAVKYYMAHVEVTRLVPNTRCL